MKIFSLIFSALFCIALTCSFFLPVGAFLGTSFSYITEQLPIFFGDKNFLEALKNSVILSSVGSVVSVILAFFFSWYLWRFTFPRGLKRYLGFFLKIPYLLPPFFLAMGWILLLAPSSGFLQKITVLPTIYGLGGALFVFIIWAIALSSIQMDDFFKTYPGVLEDAALLSGLSPLRSFSFITLPLALPYLFQCFLLNFSVGLASFAIPALLMRPVRDHVMTTKIFQAITGTSDPTKIFQEASLYAVVLLLLSLATFFLHLALKRKKSYALVGGKHASSTLLKPHFGFVLFFYFSVGLVSFTNLLPLLAIVLRSFLLDASRIDSFSLAPYFAVFQDGNGALRALWNSLWLSVITSFIMSFIALGVVYGSSRYKLKLSRFTDFLSQFGSVVPGTIVALSLLVFYAGSLTNSFGILVFAYFAHYSSYAIRTLKAPMANLSKDLEEAAYMCGASELRAFFSIVLPLLKTALSSTLILGFVPMFSELTMSVFLVSGDTEVIGTLIYRFLEYAEPGTASVITVLVLTAILASNFVIRKISKGKSGI